MRELETTPIEIDDAGAVASSTRSGFAALASFAFVWLVGRLLAHREIDPVGAVHARRLLDAVTTDDARWRMTAALTRAASLLDALAEVVAPSTDPEAPN